MLVWWPFAHSTFQLFPTCNQHNVRTHTKKEWSSKRCLNCWNHKGKPDDLLVTSDAKKTPDLCFSQNSAAFNEHRYKVWGVYFNENMEISCHWPCWGQAFIRERQCHALRRPVPEDPRNCSLIYIWDDRWGFLYHTLHRTTCFKHIWIWHRLSALFHLPALNTTRVTAFDISKLFHSRDIWTASWLKWL